jgi:hypothetical protein
MISARPATAVIVASSSRSSGASVSMLQLVANIVVVGCIALCCAAQSDAPLRFGDPVELFDDEPFFPGAQHDPSIPTPEQVLQQQHGTRLARYAEIVRCFELWAEASPRLSLSSHSTSHEGRPLLAAIVTSPANHARLDRIRADLARLVDPAELDAQAAGRLLDSLPAVAWLGYSIHGDELSGADASLAVAHHLVADTGAEVAALLDQLVIVIDPVMNPDGRERIVSMVEQLSGRVTNLDVSAMQRGRWPWGRGNHYLFDLNRDWMTGVHPETRGRWAAARDLPPQLFVDAHEMGALDTFLFYPQAEPLNPFLAATLDDWQRAFAEDQAARFDEQGWSYYTREWADGWAPFYSDAWGSLSGAIGMLYEQAGISGFPLRNLAGQVVTYRDTVRHQALSSLANLDTLARNRRQILDDFLTAKRVAIDPDAPGNGRMLVLRPGSHPSRIAGLVSLLLGQHVRVYRIDEPLSVSAGLDTLGRKHASLELPAGTLLVPAAQPYGALVKSYLDFDVRFGERFLLKEREDIERGEGTNVYDATAWSLPLLFDLDALWCDAPEVIPGLRLGPRPDAVGQLVSVPGDRQPVAWVVDGGDDRSLTFAVAAMEAGLVLVVSDEEFDADDRHFSRGSVLARRADNDDDLATNVELAASAAGVTAFAVYGGRAPKQGADLGGGHFGMLTRPRVAMLSNAPVRPDTFGHLWHVLDQRLGVPVTFLDAQSLGSVDLRRYNVLILPPGGADQVLSGWGETLSAWVHSGGTLVACGSAAAAVTGMQPALSSVKLRRNVLDELDAYELAARREADARSVSVDLADLWGLDDPEADDADETGSEATEDDDAATDEVAQDASGSSDDEQSKPDDASNSDAVVDPDASRQDAWERRFSPAGVILRGLVDDRAWLTAGCADELPVLVSGSSVLLARSPASTPVRLAPEDSLRLSGLLWPEARRRLADSAWLTVERKGAGQVILFSSVPGFRGQFLSGARLLGNAVVLGPGLGARSPLDW